MPTKIVDARLAVDAVLKNLHLVFRRIERTQITLTPQGLRCVIEQLEEARDTYAQLVVAYEMQLAEGASELARAAELVDRMAPRVPDNPRRKGDAFPAAPMPAPAADGNVVRFPAKPWPNGPFGRRPPPGGAA